MLRVEKMGDLIWRVPGLQILGNETLELTNSGGPYAEGRKVRQCEEAEGENHKIARNVALTLLSPNPYNYGLPLALEE
jgi:hypothetical protein